MYSNNCTYTHLNLRAALSISVLRSIDFFGHYQYFNSVESKKQVVNIDKDYLDTQQGQFTNINSLSTNQKPFHGPKIPFIGTNKVSFADMSILLHLYFPS